MVDAHVPITLALPKWPLDLGNRLPKTEERGAPKRMPYATIALGLSCLRPKQHANLRWRKNAGVQEGIKYLGNSSLRLIESRSIFRCATRRPLSDCPEYPAPRLQARFQLSAKTRPHERKQSQSGNLNEMSFPLPSGLNKIEHRIVGLRSHHRPLIQILCRAGSRQCCTLRA